MSSSPFLSVVIPCFDEMENLRKNVLTKVITFLNKKKFSYEVLICDDGSTDGSVTFVENFIKKTSNVFLIKNHHTGKGGAVTTGMLRAKGKFRIFLDMDQATPIEEIETCLPFFEQGYDIVIGSRSTHRNGAPFIRKFISISNIILRKFLVGIRDITDTQCGFKLFSQDAAEKLFRKVFDLHHGFSAISGSSVTAGFDVELLFIAEKMKYKIKEVPVNWQYVETRRVNPISDSIEGIKELIKIRINQLKGVYDI